MIRGKGEPAPPEKPSTAHGLLREHLTNMTDVQKRVVLEALAEHDATLAELKATKVENGNLLLDVARLTRKLLRSGDEQADKVERALGEHRGKRRR